MGIVGLQKTTLLDYPGKVASTVFFGGCNLRCPFCHNGDLVLGQALTLDRREILSFFQKRRGVLDGVCISGGEPLLQKGLGDFLRLVKDLGLCVKLDTNGTFPSRLRDLVERGLVDFVAMDIKNSLPRYTQTVGVADFDTGPVEESAAFLLGDAVDYEFRTTVVRQLHDADSFHAIAPWLAGAKAYFLQSFVDSGRLLQGGLTAWEPEAMGEFVGICTPFIKSTALRGV